MNEEEKKSAPRGSHDGSASRSSFSPHACASAARCVCLLPPACSASRPRTSASPLRTLLLLPLLFPFARRGAAHPTTASSALAQPPPPPGRVPSRQRLQSSEWSLCAPSLRCRLHLGFSLDLLLEIHRSIGGDDGLELLRTLYVPRECPHEIHRPTSAREATSIPSGGRLRIGHLHYLLQSLAAREGTSPGMCLTLSACTSVTRALKKLGRSIAMHWNTTQLEPRNLLVPSL
jgi:hypothetical protein